VYFITHTHKTNDLNDIFKRILRSKPTTVAFSLGKNQESTSSATSYRNVVSDKDGNLQITNNPYPLNLDGLPFIFNSHGNVKYEQNGFRIDGVNDNQHFDCLKNYTGPTCIFSSMCSDNDEMQTKPMARDQFNALNLYMNTDAMPNNNIKIINPQTDTVYVNPPIYNIDTFHPKLRIHCLGNGVDSNNNNNYTLEACPENSILNDRLRCTAYDICINHLNGYKHKLPINDDQILNDRQYYICQNNKSILMECSENSIFDDRQKACIIPTQDCHNKNDGYTIYLNDKKYTLCEHGMAKTIDCNDSYVIDRGYNNYTCYESKCEPHDYIYKNNNITYTYARYVCNETTDTGKLIECNQSTTEKTYNYSWAEDFQITIPHWPNEILNSNNVCVQPQPEDILYNPIINVRWSKVMFDTHPFNILTKEYDCSNTDTQYRWDYINNTIIPSVATDESNNLTIFSGSPCQNAIEPTQFVHKTENYPPDKIYIIKTEPVHIPTNLKHTIYHWPVYKPSKNRYLITKFTNISNDSEAFSYKTITSKTIPLGFERPEQTNKDSSTVYTSLSFADDIITVDDGYLQDPNQEENIKLNLIGYQDAPTDLKAQYYYISDGKSLKTCTMVAAEITSTQIVKYLAENTLKTQSIEPNDNVNFALDYKNIKSNIVITANTKETITITPNKELILRNADGNIENTINLGYSIFNYRRIDDNTGILELDDIVSLEIDVNEVPEIYF